MPRWKYSTPCDVALQGEDHEPHDYTHADQTFWCDGEGIEHTPIEGTGYMQWLDEVDWERVDWDKVVAAENRHSMAKALDPLEELTFKQRVIDWIDYTPLVKFYSILTILGAFGLFLIAITYLLYRNY